MMKYKDSILLFCLAIVLWCQVGAQAVTIDPKREAWVDSILQTMTLDERVGQLFMIRAFSKDDPEHINYVKKQIKDFHVGGVCFFQGDPQRQVALVRDYQGLSRIPMFISIDGEWGLGMRFFDQAFSYPKQLTIGAINDHQLIYRMGQEIGRHCLATGINLNFAPSVDVNNNINNPVINFRSFGEDRYNVAAKGYAYMKGMSDVGVMSSAKHFPGHGDTDVDSHHDLPIINHSRQRLDSIELFPFKMLIKQGVPSIMVAHLQIPAWEPDPTRATTVSKNVVTNLLRNQLGYERLIMTDAMEMKGVTKHFGPGEADLEAFLAGNDMILLPEKIENGIAKIKAACLSGVITPERLEASLKRILREKYILGLNHYSPPTLEGNLSEMINNKESKVLRRKIFEKALTLVANDHKILPILNLRGSSYGSISLGADAMTGFQRRLLSYIDMDHYHLPKKTTIQDYELKIAQLSQKDVVFVSVHDMSWHARFNYGLENDQIEFIKRLSEKTKVVLTIFGSP